MLLVHCDNDGRRGAAAPLRRQNPPAYSGTPNGSVIECRRMWNRGHRHECCVRSATATASKYPTSERHAGGPPWPLGSRAPIRARTPVRTLTVAFIRIPSQGLQDTRREHSIVGPDADEVARVCFPVRQSRRRLGSGLLPPLHGVSGSESVAVVGDIRRWVPLPFRDRRGRHRGATSDGRRAWARRSSSGVTPTVTATR